MSRRVIGHAAVCELCRNPIEPGSEVYADDDTAACHVDCLDAQIEEDTMSDPRAGRDGIRHRDDCRQPRAESRVESNAVVRHCPECSRAAAIPRPMADPVPVETDDEGWWEQ